MKISVPVILASLSIAAGAPGAPPRTVDRTPREMMQASTAVTIRYFDPARERPSPTSAGSIDSWFDVEVNLNCDGLTCSSGLRLIASLINTSHSVDQPCRQPSYVRFQFTSEAGIQGIVYVDYTGHCITFGNNYYTSARDLIWELRNSRISDW